MEIISNPTHFLSSSSRHQFPRFFSPQLSNPFLPLSHGTSILTHRSSLSLSKSASIATTTFALADDGIGVSSGAEVANDLTLEARRKAADLSLRGTSIFLVGMKSSLKTNLGKLLAEVFNYYYFDSDEVVEQAAGGSSAAQSFRESDEEGFRATETEVLKQLTSMVRLVVCAGDGAVQSSTNLALLRDGLSLWVDIPLTTTPSSMISADSSSEVLAASEDLRGRYGTADGTISLQRVAAKLGYETLDSVTPEDMLLEVLNTIEKLMSAKKMMEAAATPF
ncbi:unnamed protein product [Linum trigynum]|uniref:Shikimate kinase n=1 Tax=Linum trigynum TaxID=586398 RepID=A0AAV2FLC5_9ROSI